MWTQRPETRVQSDEETDHTNPGHEQKPRQRLSLFLGSAPCVKHYSPSHQVHWVKKQFIPNPCPESLIRFRLVALFKDCSFEVLKLKDGEISFIFFSPLLKQHFLVICDTLCHPHLFKGNPLFVCLCTLFPSLTL